MLYVSRVTDVSHYGVVDTDDETETSVSWPELKDLVILHNLDVKGVTINNNIGGRYMSAVTPWQDPRYYTQHHLKTKTLLGVDVRTWREFVTFIEADARVAKDGVRIRLSEFGSKMSGRTAIRWRNVEYLGVKQLFLILDDNLSIIHNAPSLLTAHGVVWDIRESHNMPVIDEMYKMLRANRIPPESWNQHILDDPKRMRRWG